MTVIHIPLRAIKGRGTSTHLAHRFGSVARDAFDDGWGGLDELSQAQLRPPQTVLRMENTKSAITRNDSPDIYFDYGLNPYRGCEHGCIYCYARPTHGYLNLSPGLNFETQIIASAMVRSRLLFMLITIHVMINPAPNSPHPACFRLIPA